MRYRFFAAFLALGTCVPQRTSAADRPAAGYVVKEEAGTVYLDKGEGAASVGQTFVIYEEGEELKHPKTGESLGRIETELARGAITAVMPKYSAGHILARPAIYPPATDFPPIKAGAAYRLLPVEPTPPALAAPQTMGVPPAMAPAGAQSPGLRAAFWRSPTVEIEAADMAAGDLFGDGKTEIILAGDHRVLAYPESGPDFKPLCSFEEKGTGVKFLSVDAADPDKSGKAKVFAVYFNSFFNRVETIVLECRDGAFVKTATLPWMTRAYPDAAGNWRLASQQLIDDPTFPFASIYDLEFKEGKYAQGGVALKLNRVDLAYGFALAQDPSVGEPFHLFYSHNDSIRVQFQKGNWVSPETYGQTSSRVRWYDHNLMFRPRLIPTSANGALAGVYVIKNIPGFGGLAGAFGYYNSSELHYLRWTGMSLEPAWKADLGGYAADVALARPDTAHPEELLVAVVGKGGRTSIWKFNP